MADRHWELVYADDEKNTWLIAWPPGSGLDWHDHGESAVTIIVLDGELYEEVEGEGFDSLAPGLLYVRGVGVRHRIQNVTEFGAVSVHTYSPPLSADVPGTEISS